MVGESHHQAFSRESPGSPHLLYCLSALGSLFVHLFIGSPEAAATRHASRKNLASRRSQVGRFQPSCPRWACARMYLAQAGSRLGWPANRRHVCGNVRKPRLGRCNYCHNCIAIISSGRSPRLSLRSTLAFTEVRHTRISRSNSCLTLKNLAGRTRIRRALGSLCCGEDWDLPN